MATATATEKRALDVWVRLLRGHAATARALNAQLVRDHDLTINDYEVLLLLAHAEDGRLRRTDLAQNVQLSPSGVTRLLDGLEAAGFVEKGVCASDGRVVYAVLTAAGRDKLETAACSHVRAIAELFETRYTEEELATLAELLGRLPGGGGSDSNCTVPADAA